MNKFPIRIGEPTKKSIATIVFNVLIILLIMIIIFQSLFNMRYSSVYVVGDSMMPTLTGEKTTSSGALIHRGDYLYLDKYATAEKGDIVVINYYDEVGEKTTTIIKRVIAVQGEVVQLKAGVLYINGVEIEESYINSEYNDPKNEKNTFGPYTVKPNCVFVMGDNRNVSNDSRSETYRDIERSSIVGVVTDWSMSFKTAITSWNTFFNYTIFNL